MKKLLLLLIIISAINLSAQTNDHLKNSRWINGHYEVNPLGPTFNYHLRGTAKYCTTTEDTLIGGMNYVKLFDCSQQPYTYHGALRIDTTRWYFYSRDSTEEMMLYDFGLKVGDTLELPFYTENGRYWGTGLGEPVLNQIDTIIINGENRRVFYFNNFSAWWIEGIGNSQGFLWHPYPNISGLGWSLECYSKSDTIRYNYYTYNTTNFNEACQLSFSVDDNTLKGTEVFPNPASKSFSLTIPAFSGSLLLKIFTIDGKEVHRQNIQQAQLTVAPNLSPGYYIIKIEDKQGMLKFRERLVWE